MTKNLATALVGVLAISAAVTTTTFAREPGIPRGERTFERLDKDKNGALALDELQLRSARRFMRLDADKDDKVTRAELEDWLNNISKRRIDRILSRMDADQDSTVTRQELDSYISGMFSEADKDNSGGVTLQETRDYHAAKRNQRIEARKASRQTRQ
ncbi:MAG: EF-hand domain-containing protein [Anderseniella sp.]